MKKLTRSRDDRMLSGICGGIAEYFDIDSTIIRLGFVVLIFMSLGISVVVYLISSLVIPEDDRIIHQDNLGNDENDKNDNHENYEKTRKNTPIFVGLGLILWGSYLITRRVFPHIFYRMRYIWNYWPILLIILGLYVIFQPKDK